AGAEVTLVTGPTAIAPPGGGRTFRVESAEELRDAVLATLPRADAVVMAAAVADYRPIERVDRKLKKKELGRELTLRLIENPDVLKAIVAARRPGTIVVGFKAETGDATAEAGRMLREKKLDLVVANDVSDPRSGFGSEDDRAGVGTGPVERVFAVFDEICDLYARSDPGTCAALREIVHEHKARGLLPGYLSHCARVLEQGGRQEWLERGLAAASIDDQRHDYR